MIKGILRATRSITCLGFLSAVVLLPQTAQAEGDWAVPEDPSKFHIFIFAGQSNMAGGFNESHLYDDEGNYDPVTDPVPRILQYRGKSGWRPAAHPLTRHVKTSFSLPLPFAERYLDSIDDPEVRVGIAISAFGGKAINFFMPGGTMHPGSAKHLKDIGTIKGFIWHQGESDNRMEERETYAQKFHALAKLIREYADDPDLPVITGAFNPQWAWSNPYSIPPGPEGNPETQEDKKRTWGAYESQITTGNVLAHIDVIGHAGHVHSAGAGHVSEHQRKLVDENGKPTGETKRVPTDNTHFNRHGYTTLGRRYAELILGRPAFKADPVIAVGTTGREFSFDLNAAACDIAGDKLSFAAEDLPKWLTLTPDGKLIGTPPAEGESTFPITVTDEGGLSYGSNFRLVTRVGGTPGFKAKNFSRKAAIPGRPYEDRVRYQWRKPQSSELLEPNNDTIRFSKVDGPGWLGVDADGRIYGIPTTEDAGKTQTLTVKAIDPDGETNATYTIPILGEDVLWHESFKYVADIRHRAVGDQLVFDRAMPTDTWFLKIGHFPAQNAEDPFVFTDLVANLSPESHKFSRGTLRALALVVDEKHFDGHSGKTQFNIDLPAEVEKEDKGRGAGRRAKKKAALDPDVAAGKDAHFIVSLYQFVPGDAPDAGFDLALAAKKIRGLAAPVSPAGGAKLTKLAERNYKMGEAGVQSLDFEYDGTGHILLVLSASRDVAETGGGRKFDNLSFKRIVP